MQLICPACRTPLPVTPGKGVLTCGSCSAEVDISRAGTAAGRPRFVPEIDRTGDTVNGWLLEARIGSGGMGTVYRVSKDAKRAAIKFLAPSLSAEPEIVERFRREISLLEKLDHPAIVHILDHGEEDGVPWFAMELVEGSDLKARLAKGVMPVAEAAPLFALIFEALGHAHSKGVVHRDLKPANVLLAADGAKLADFGIARTDGAAGSAATRLTESAAILGTFPYMSPEQRAGANVDRRSDLFSAGVMLYEALTGVVPQGSWAPPSEVDKSVPARVDQVVARLMRQRPEARYGDAREAALELAEATRPRTPIWPVAAAGVLAAGLLSAVMLPWGSFRGAGGSKVKSASEVASVVQGQSAGTAVATTPGATETPANNAALAGNLGLGSLGTKNGKPVPQQLNAGNQQLANEMEKVAKAEPVKVRVMMTCDPTLVYEKPRAGAAIVDKLPSGTYAQRLPGYVNPGVKSKAELDPPGLSVGRFPVVLAEMSAQPQKPQAKDDIPQQAPPVNQQSFDDSQKQSAKPKVIEAPTAWVYIRIGNKISGWVDQRCEQDVPADSLSKKATLKGT